VRIYVLKNKDRHALNPSAASGSGLTMTQKVFFSTLLNY